MRAVIVLISFVGVLLGARIGWQIGLLMGLGAMPMLEVPAGAGTTATTWLFAGGGVLIGGLVGGAVCLLIARFLWRLAAPQH